MSETKLSEPATRVLRQLERAERLDWGSQTAYEIACGCGEERRAADWAHGKLRVLSWHKLVEPAGVAGDTNARTWRLTEAGRAALLKARSTEVPSGEE